jgi:hypothetical protein
MPDVFDSLASGDVFDHVAAPSPSMQSPATPAETDRGVFSGIGAGLARGVGGMLNAADSYADYVNATHGIPAPTEGSSATEALGLPNPRDLGRRIVDANPASPSVEQGGAFQPDNWRWYTEKGTEMVPMLLTQMGMLAATKGESAPMQFMAFAGPAAVQAAGNTYQDALKRTGDSNLAAGEATMNGLVTLAMQRVNLAPLLSNSATKKYFQDQLLNRVAEMGAKAFQEGGANAAVSVAQTATEDALKYAAEHDPKAFADWKARYAGAAVQGAVAGTVIGGIHAAGDRGVRDPMVGGEDVGNPFGSEADLPAPTFPLATPKAPTEAMKPTEHGGYPEEQPSGPPPESREVQPQGESNAGEVESATALGGQRGGEESTRGGGPKGVAGGEQGIAPPRAREEGKVSGEQPEGGESPEHQDATKLDEGVDFGKSKEEMWNTPPSQAARIVGADYDKPALGGKDTWRQMHEGIIRDAIAEGKDVPEAVRKEIEKQPRTRQGSSISKTKTATETTEQIIARKKAEMEAILHPKEPTNVEQKTEDQPRETPGRNKRKANEPPKPRTDELGREIETVVPRYGKGAGTYDIKPIDFEPLKVGGANAEQLDHKAHAKDIIRAYEDHVANTGRTKKPLTVESMKAVDAAYKAHLVPIDPGYQKDAHLWAFPGKEEEMRAIRRKMEEIDAKKSPPYEPKMAKLKKAPPKQLPRGLKSPKDILAAASELSGGITQIHNMDGYLVQDGGKNALITDGHSAIRLRGNDGDFGEPGRYNGSGKPLDAESLPFPEQQIESLFRGVSGTKIDTLDLDHLMRRVRQIEAMAPSEGLPVVTVALNLDGTLGFGALSQGEGVAEVGIKEGARELGYLNVEKLRKLLELHAKTASPGMTRSFVSMTWPEKVREPVLIKSSGTETLLMPIESGSDAGSGNATNVETIRAELRGEPREGKPAEPVENKALATQEDEQSAGADENAIADGDIHGFGGPVGKAAAATVKSFVKSDAVPKVLDVAKAIGDAAADIRDTFAPQTRDKPAGVMSRIVRERASELARRTDRAEAAMEVARKYFDGQPEAERLDFIAAVEAGKPQSNPALDAFAKILRNHLDGRRNEIRLLGTGKLAKYIADYFPHIWKDPVAAGKWAVEFTGKRPLEGGKAFLKKRSIPTIEDGIKAGLVPVSTNPVDLVLLKLREMDRYLMGQKILGEAKASSLVQFVRATEKAPDGYAKIDDRIASVYAPPTIPVHEYVDRAQYKALMEVARQMGIKPERVASALTEARKMGWAHPPKGLLGFAQKGTGRTVSRFATGMSVLAHELGHQIDFKWDLVNTVAKGHQAELNKITDLRFIDSPTPTAKQRAYNYSAVEQAAHIIEAYVSAPERMKDVAPTIYKNVETFISQHPELEKLSTESALSLERVTTNVPHGGLLKRGEYYALEGAANVLNNYLSPGLRGKSAVFRAAMGAGNLLNQAQLGLSAFHLGFTSLDASVSKLALGLQHLSDGNVSEFAKHLALTPLAPIENLVRGDKVLREWMRPGSAGGNIPAIVDAMQSAGGRAGMDRFYQTTWVKAAATAFREGNYLGAAVRGPFAALEALSAPIMQWIVPRQKMGIFADMAKRELAKLPPGASVDDVRKVMGRAWDSVDNRMGQLVYDNLFWNKTAKDVGMASIRSLGWNLGTLRELGGGALDALMQGKKALSGVKPELTYRTAYVAALPILTGILGATYQYLATGSGPTTARDMYFPKTGEKDDDGKDLRVSFPSYMKDLYAYEHNPGQTLLHKLHPDIGMMADMFRNQDYYGNQIRNEDDPVMQQLLDLGSYAGKQFVPFGIRNATQAGSVRGSIMPFIGVTPAPKSVLNTQAEELAGELARESMPVGGKTKEAAEKAANVRQVRKGFAAGKDTRDEALASGKITADDANRIGREEGQSYLFRTVHKLDDNAALKVLAVSNEKERDQLYDMVIAKIYNSRRAGEEKEAMIKVAEKYKPKK